MLFATPVIQHRGGPFGCLNFFALSKRDYWPVRRWSGSRKERGLIVHQEQRHREEYVPSTSLPSVCHGRGRYFPLSNPRPFESRHLPVDAPHPRHSRRFDLGGGHHDAVRLLRWTGSAMQWSAPLPSEGRGQRFESSRARHSPPRITFRSHRPSPRAARPYRDRPRAGRSVVRLPYRQGGKASA